MVTCTSSHGDQYWFISPPLLEWAYTLYLNTLRTNSKYVLYRGARGLGKAGTNS